MKLNFRTVLIMMLLFFQTGTFDAQAAKPVNVPTEQSISTKKEDRPKKNKLALWSFILSAAGFAFMLFPYLSIASPYLFVGGIVTGILALSKIKKNKERGKGLAIAGLIIGGVSILAIMAAVLLLLALFG